MEINNYSPTEIERAHALWLKLKEAFNKEAARCDPGTNTSKLGPIGDKGQSRSDALYVVGRTRRQQIWRLR